MKIITTNFPKNTIERMDVICGKEGLHPSRSEFVRSAILRFIIEEMNKVIKNKKILLSESKDEINKNIIPIVNPDTDTIQIPRLINGELSYKTYKLIKK